LTDYVRPACQLCRGAHGCLYTSFQVLSGHIESTVLSSTFVASDAMTKLYWKHICTHRCSLFLSVHQAGVQVLFIKVLCDIRC